MKVKEFKKLPVLGILRGIKAGDIEPITETAVASGLKTIEIAMNTPDVEKLIKLMVKIADGRLTVGAGTVLTKELYKRAVDNGATFIVMPTFVKEIVEECVKRTVPVFPGAFTPQEIYNAWSGGATMVKVFPAKFFGPDYIKEVRGPFGEIEILACGGVSAGNIKSFFAAGASAVAFGESVFKKEWIAEKKFDLIGAEIKGLIKEFQR